MKYMEGPVRYVLAHWLYILRGHVVVLSDDHPLKGEPELCACTIFGATH